MKTYEEMTRSVMDKAKTRRAAQKRRNTRLALSAASLCLVMVSAVLIGSLTGENVPSVTLENPTNVTSNSPSQDVTGTQVVKPRFTLLCASTDGEPPKVMAEKVKVPYKAELRVRDISGMTEEEKRQLGKEEAAYIKKLWGDLADESGFGRYMLDNVMVTTISVGEFGVKLDNVDMVARIRVSVTENGMLMSYPRVEEGKTSAYTFEDGQQLLIDIYGESLKACLEQNDRDTLGLFWQISPWAVTKLDKEPDMDLSQFSDQITIRIDYTDGREEVSVVRMQVDSDGKVYAVLEETLISA